MRKLIYNCSLLASLCLSVSIHPVLAQETELEVREMVKNAPESQLVVESSRMLQDDYYFFSEIATDKLLTLKPESSNYNYRKGFIVLGSRGDYITALPFLEKGAKQISKNYDAFSSKEAGAPTDVYYHLAKCYHLSENIDKAEEFYNKFILESNKKSELLPKAQLALKQCALARVAIANPKSSIVKNIGNVVNNEYADYAPVISLDGKSLYFTSRRPWSQNETDVFRDPKLNNFPEDIYMSSNNGAAGWANPVKMGFCSPEINEATIAVSPDERRIYAYEDVTGAGDLYFSDFSNNSFQTLEQVESNGVNTEFWETHCTVTPDGRNMYFVSDRPGGFGGRDIYRIVKLPDGTWSEPVNMGPKINSAYDEESPYITVDNKTMYFASNGPNSIGGFDIFITVRDENNNWSPSINLGYPINRTGDDLFYTTTIDGRKGYLSSFRPEGFGEKDIYEIQNDYTTESDIVVLKGAIVNLDGGHLPEESHITIRCTKCNDTEITRVPTRIRDGAFISMLKACTEYEIVYMENNTKEISREIFSTECLGGYQEVYKEVTIGGQYELIGKITDKKSGLPIANATVQLIDPKTKNTIVSVVTDASGKYATNLLDGKGKGDEIALLLKISAPNYLAKSSEFSTTLGNKRNIEILHGLDRIDVGTDIGKTIELSLIYFDLDKSNIRPDAKIELDKIVKIMNENPTIEIELGSHTDCRASVSYNEKLSDRRAKSSAAYIRARISKPSRINGKGYGESQLVNNCGCEGEKTSDCSEEEHQANRRTEFKIVKL